MHVRVPSRCLTDHLGTHLPLASCSYNYTLDPSVLLAVVNAVSRPNQWHRNYGPENVDWPFKRGERTCTCSGGNG